MINIVLDGGILEIENLKISIKKENNAYNFGKFTLDRTQSVSVPKTAKNMRLLGLGDFHLYGEKERRYHNAQIVGEGIAERGTLYVDKIDTNELKCIFVFTAFQPLKELSNEKMATRLEPYDQEIEFSSSNRPIKASGDLLPVDMVLYYNKNVLYKLSQASYGWIYSNILPSISVQDILAWANQVYEQQLDVNVVDNYRIIMAGNLKNAERENIVLAKTDNATSAPNQDLKTIITMIRRYGNTASTYNSSGDRGRRNEREILCYNFERCTLQFPEDFPDDIFLLADYTHYESWDGFVVVDLQFFGGYEFDWSQKTIVDNINQEAERAVTGVPLAGKSVEIGEVLKRTYYNSNNSQQVVVQPKLSFYRKADFHNTISTTYGDRYRYAGFFTGDASPFSFTFPSVEKSNLINSSGSVIGTYLLDNLPNISFLELYNTIAFLQKKIVVKNGDILTMRGYDENEYMTLKNIISIGTVERVGLAEAKNNIVEFSKSNTQLEAERIKNNYQSENDIFKDESILLTIPFSEGQNLQNSLYINDIKETADDWATYEYQGDKFTIAKNNGGDYLEQVANPYNEVLEAIARESTRIQVTARMSLYEYNKIKETTRLIVQGAKFVWTSSNWSDNKAKFTLQKI
jgi:hypothetical protein